ncbi:hypothetical protein [Massilia sp.]|uniref:hypothetical protein n=1 Tax=Massilia sp. TaxID=1882437 RepID=UPI00352F60C9
MNKPLHETLRAIGQIILVSSLAGIGGGYLLAQIVLHFGIAGLVVLAIGTGAGFITVANELKRREQRKRGGAQ